MASDKLSQKIFDLSKYVEDLKGIDVSEPDKAAEILSKVIEELQVHIDELKAAETAEKLTEKHSLCILIAEYALTTQRHILMMLTCMGYKADSVRNGMEVLQALEIRPYDVILMDTKMPNMDGITTAKEIRKRWPNNGPRIVALTDYCLGESKESCIEAGMDDYIIKPITPNDLLAKVLKR